MNEAHRIHAKDVGSGGAPMLHADDVCLYRPLPDVDASAFPVRAIGRLLAESMEQARSEDGMAACASVFLYTDAYPTLADAFAHLLSYGASVSVRDVRGCTQSAVHVPTEGSVVVRVPGARWTPTCLVTSTVHHEERARVNEPIHAAEAEWGHEYVLSNLAPCEHSMLAPRVMRDVSSSSTRVVRMTRVEDEGGRSSVALYRNGVLWEVDTWSDQGRTTRLIVDVWGGDKDEGGIFVEEDVTARGAEVVGALLLHADTIASLVRRSPIATRLVQDAASWSGALNRVWRGSRKSVELLLRSPCTPSCIPPLLDAEAILRPLIRKHERMHLTGMSILRRMQTQPTSAHNVDWVASVADEFAILRFDVVPLSASRFRDLHRMGCFSESCDYAFMTRDDASGDRALVCPVDATASTITLAIATMLKCDVSLACDDEREARIRLCNGSTLSETSTACHPDETLSLYRVGVDAESGDVVLVYDAEEGSRVSTQSASLDSLASRGAAGLPTSPDRCSHDVLRTFFPSLSKRMDLVPSRDESFLFCVRDAQARRVCREWTLGGLDEGRNASGLGLSVLLCLSLGGWLGARVRVAMSRTRAGMLAAWTGSAFEMFDPTRTMCNMYDASQYLSRVPQGGYEVHVSSGVVVEVRSASKWVAGVVKSVDVHKAQFVVERLGNGHTLLVSLNAHTWRRVTDDASDLDAQVRRMHKRQKS